MKSFHTIQENTKQTNISSPTSSSKTEKLIQQVTLTISSELGGLGVKIVVKRPFKSLYTVSLVYLYQNLGV